MPLLIQQKLDGFDYFNRSWEEYKVGFNDYSGNYWLGNELLSHLTLSDRYKLKFELQSRKNGHWYHAEYTTFVVLKESSNYTLHVSGYSGNASRDALGYSNDMMFTTYDRDNDRWPSGNCAVRTGGGFWHRRCTECDVNSVGDDGPGAHAFGWKGLPGGDALQTSRMWLHCK